MTDKTYTLWFNPTTDITAFELASVILTVPFDGSKGPVSEHGITATEEQWKRVPPPLRRYFTKDSPWGPKNAVDELFGEAQAVAVGPATPVMDTFAARAAEAPKGPGKQPTQKVSSFYGDDVSSLIPDGMEIKPE